MGEQRARVAVAQALVGQIYRLRREHNTVYVAWGDLVSFVGTLLSPLSYLRPLTCLAALRILVLYDPRRILIRLHSHLIQQVRATSP